MIRYRAVTLGFCLTFLLAGGTGYAFALWSQSGSATMQVKAGTLPSPQLQCSDTPDESEVLVTWTPQRAGVTGYDVTVARDGKTIKSLSYPADVTSERITPSAMLGMGEYAYAVTVTAKYGLWTKAASLDSIRETVPLLGAFATISCY